MRADAPTFIPAAVEVEKSMNALLSALTSSNDERDTTSRWPKRQTRQEKTEAKRLAIRRLVSSARDAGARAESAEAKCIQLEAEVVRLRIGLEGAPSSVPNAKCASTLALLQDFLDRVACSADFLAPSPNLTGCPSSTRLQLSAFSETLLNTL